MIEAMMAKMAAGNKMAAMRHAATREGTPPNCCLACGKDQHRSPSQSLARHACRSGGFSRSLSLLTLSLSRKFLSRQAAWPASGKVENLAAPDVGRLGSRKV
jgi:hypothetical protein